MTTGAESNIAGNSAEHLQEVELKKRRSLLGNIKTESVLLMILIVGLMSKYFHWGPADLIVLLALLSFGAVYFLMAPLILSDMSIKRQNLGFSILSGMCFCLVPIGMLYKILSWQGSDPMLLVGSISSIFLLVLAGFTYLRSDPELKIYYRNLVRRAVIISLIGIFFFLIQHETVIKIQHQDDPELARIKLERLKDPKDPKYQQMEEDLWHKRDSIWRSRNE